jgi:hypothetical protein
VEKQVFDTAMNSVNLAQKLVDEWLQCCDVYTDELFWYNPKEQTLSVEPPSLEHYLPTDFTVPNPPHDLPPGVGLETSSSEDEAAAAESGARPRSRGRDIEKKKSRKGSAKKQMRQSRKTVKPSTVIAEEMAKTGKKEKLDRDKDSDDSEEESHEHGKDAKRPSASEGGGGSTGKTAGGDFARSRSRVLLTSGKDHDFDYGAADGEFDDGVSAMTALASITAQIDEKKIRLTEVVADDEGSTEQRRPLSAAIRNVKPWKALPHQVPGAVSGATTAPASMNALINLTSSRSLGSLASSRSTNTSTSATESTDKMYVYGPDSLRVGRPGQLLETYVPPVVVSKPPEVMELHRKVAVAREYIGRSAAHQVPEQHAVVALENPGRVCCRH